MRFHRLHRRMNFKPVVALTLCAAVVPAAELPVQEVVLYKHGVGFFERQGTLRPGESARLDFKSGEMNDVLKSLTVVDQGGKVTGLRYDSSIPLEQKLGDFPFAIGNGQALSGVIDQLKGARIEMDFGTQKVSGAVVSARLIAGDKDHPEREQLTLLLDSGELRNVDLAAATSIRFADPKLHLQFRDYLTALTDARSKDKRGVYIDSTDSKSRDVRAEYIIPMPAWKSSYRLIFDKDGTQPTLEGWAIVDNTTGEDWTKVHLSLVSGKPISFVSQLYPPKYIARPGAELAEDQALAPTVYGGNMASVKAAPAAGFAGTGRFQNTDGAPLRIGGNVANGTLGGMIGGIPSASQSMRVDQSSIAPTGAAQEIADLFEYTIGTPVTIRKDESAMLPFLQQKISARKLIIYSDTSRTNPYSAAELTNNTGKTLDGGPITVFDAGAYAGEALVETFKTDDKRFINYGVDLGTRISTNLDSQTDNIREVHVHNGMLVTRSALVQKRVYAVKNVDARAKTLIIEYPIRTGYKLVDTAKPSETAKDVYRFEVKVPASGSVDFPLTDENVYDRQFSLTNFTPDQLVTYIRNRDISDNARKQLQQIADLKTRIASTDTQRRGLTDQINTLTQDETRNRENISRLSQVSGQQQVVQDYARKLTEQETQIDKMHQQQGTLDQQKTTLQTQLNDLIEKLDF
jgi:hypothetical protein